MNLKKAQKNVKAQEAKIKQDRIASRPQRKVPAEIMYISYYFLI